MADKLRLDVELNISQQQLNAQTREIIRKARQLDREFSKIGGSDFSSISSSFTKSQAALVGITKESVRTKGALSDVGNQAKLTARRFIVYNVIAGFFFRLANAVREGIGAFVDFNSTLNKAEQILNPLTTNISDLKQSVFDLGKEFGISISNVQAAQETFIRQGATLKQTIDLTRASLALSTAGELEAADATDALTAAIRIFNIEASKAITVSDKYAAVAANFAVETRDFKEAVERAGSAAITVGVDLDNLIGFITAAQEASRRGGAVIGTALRTIFTRVTRESSIQALEELGIQTREVSGEFRDVTSILTDLAGKFNTLSRSQQLNIASTIAGQRQISTLLALLQNFDRAVLATNTSLDSQGFALALTRKRQESVEAQLNKITNDFKQFGVAVGEAFSGDVLNIINGFIDVFKTVGTTISSLLSVIGAEGAGEGLVKTFAKMAFWIGVGQIGLGRILNKGVDLLPLNRKINQSLEDQVKSNKLVFDIEKGKFTIQKQSARQLDIGVKARTAEAVIQKSQKEVVALQRSELNNQLSIQKELSNIEIQKLGIAQEELNLKKLTGVELKLQAKEEKLIADAKERANKLRKRQETIRISPQAAKNEEEQKFKLGDKLSNLLNKRNELDVSTQVKAKKLAGDTLAIQERINALKTKLSEPGGKTNKQRLDNQAQIQLEIEQSKQELADKTNAIRDRGLKKGVDLELQILRVQQQQTDIVDRQAKRRLEQVRVGGELGRLTQETTRNAKGIEAERAALNMSIDASTAAIAQKEQTIVGSINKANTLRTGSVARQQKVAALTAQIEANQKRLNVELDKQNSKVTRGGKAFAVAFGISLITNEVGNALRTLGDEGSRGLQAATSAVEGFGSALTSIAIVGGPIGLILGGIQLIITTSKIFKDLEVDANKTLKSIQDGFDKTINVTRVFNSSLTTLSDVAAKANIGQGLGLDDLDKVDEAIMEIAKSTGIASGEMSALVGTIKDAVIGGDIDKLKSSFEELQRIATIRAIKEGSILNRKTIFDALDGYTRTTFAARKLLDTIQKFDKTKKFNFTLENINSADAAAAVQELAPDLKDVGTAFAEVSQRRSVFFNALVTESDSALKQFSLLVDGSQTFGQNLSNLGDDAISALQVTGRLNDAFDIFLRKQGIIRSTSLFQASRKQNIQEIEDVKTLGKEWDSTSKNIKAVRPLLDSLGIAAGQAAEVGFTFSKSFFDSAAGEQFIKQLAKINKTTVEHTRNQVKSIKENNRAIFLEIDANGNLALSSGQLGLNISSLDGNFNTIASTLTGQLTPATLQVANSTNELNQAFLNAGVLSDAFQQRLKSSAQIITGNVDRMTELSNAVRDTESNFALLKDVFTAEFFTTPLKGADALIQSVHDNNIAVNSALTVFDKLKTLTTETSFAIADDLAKALQTGVTGTTLFDARIRESSKGLEQANAILDSYIQSIGGLDKSNTSLGFTGREITNLAKGRAQLEQVAQALSGLVAFRDKLDASSAGTPILEKDRKSAEAFLNTIKNILPGIDTDSVKKFLSFKASNKDSLSKGLGDVFRNIQLEAGKLTNPVLAQIIANFGKAINEATEAATKEGTGSATRTIGNLLFEDIARFTKESQGLLDAFLQSVRDFSGKNAEQLNQAIDLTQKRLVDLAQATRSGSFLPDFSGRDIDILKQNFARIRTAAVQQRSLLEAELKPIKEEFLQLVQITDKFSKGNALNAISDEQRKQLEKLKQKQTEVATLEEKIANTKVVERTVTANFIQQFQASLDLLNNAQKEVFSTQASLAESQSSFFSKQVSFIDQETAGFEKRIALIETEGAAIEKLTREATGLGDLDVSKIAERLTKLTGDLVAKRREGADAGTIQVIQQRIADEERYLTIVKDINSKRITSLEKELELINQQSEAIRGLADEFLKSNDSQQKQIIDSARLVEQFFGSLTPDALNSGQFKQTAARFLTETNDELRNAVLTQLERLKNVGGEVAPGVQAGQVLRQLSESVVGALFKSPQQVVLDKQLEVQSRILDVMKDSNAIAEIQNRLAVQASSDIRRSIDSLLRQGSAGTLDTSPETQNVAKSLQEQLSSGQQEISAINSKRARSELELSDASGQAAIRNKALVDTFSKLDTTTQSTQQSAEQYQEKLVQLRDAFIKADDDFRKSQEAYTTALVQAGQALAKVSVAQADYSIQLELARRESLNVVGGFATFRDELAFLNGVFDKQIQTLKAVGATEEDIANLRIRLAQESLNVIQGQLQTFRDNAERLFTGGPDVATSFKENFARAQFAATQARQIGITPGKQATDQQSQELFTRLQGLPSDVKQGILEGLRSAPPNATFGGFSPKELENAIIAGAGGGIAGDTILELEKQAAQQRQIIAENSISGLASARQTAITALDQLSTAQENLQEAKAQKELAQLQLDSMSSGFEETVRAIDVVAANLTTIDSTLNRAFSSANGGVSSAARGTLSGSEVAGLLNAASREKASMPSNSKLGVFNTSETVLTRSQMNRLRTGVSTPNAADGTAVVSPDILPLLQQISDKLSLLTNQGVKQNFQIDINNQRNVSIEGLAGLQTALQNIINDRTGDLYSREEAQALQSIVMTVVQKMQQTGQISAIGT